GRTAEMPDEGRTFQSPHIPNSVIPDITRLIEGETALVETALRSEALHNLVLIGLAIRFNERFQNLLSMDLLVLREFADRNPRNCDRASETDQRFVRRFGNQSELPLLAVQHLEQGVRFE